MQKIKFFILASLLVVLHACGPDAPPAPYQYNTKPAFTWGWADFYGHYYNNYDIENNVFTLQLFTGKLGANENNELVGTGQYLIIEDVFQSPIDTLLQEGTYAAAETGEPFTFYPGKGFKDSWGTIPSGAYIHYIEADPAKSKIAYVTDGSFTVNIKNDTIYTIQCDFILDKKTELKGTYTDVLYHVDRRSELTPEKERTFLLKKKRTEPRQPN